MLMCNEIKFHRAIQEELVCRIPCFRKMTHDLVNYHQLRAS